MAEEDDWATGVVEASVESEEPGCEVVAYMVRREVEVPTEESVLDDTCSSRHVWNGESAEGVRAVVDGGGVSFL